MDYLTHTCSDRRRDSDADLHPRRPTRRGRLIGVARVATSRPHASFALICRGAALRRSPARISLSFKNFNNRDDRLKCEAAGLRAGSAERVANRRRRSKAWRPGGCAIALTAICGGDAEAVGIPPRARHLPSGLAIYASRRHMEPRAVRTCCSPRLISGAAHSLGIVNRLCRPGSAGSAPRLDTPTLRRRWRDKNDQHIGEARPQPAGDAPTWSRWLHWRSFEV